MIRFLVCSLWLVHALTTKAVFARQENRGVHLSDETTAKGSRALAVVEIPPYKGVVDDISDDSPTTFTARISCGEATDDTPFYYQTPGIARTPEEWDLYRLDLDSSYSYIIKVNPVDCGMNPEFSLYKGVATAANSSANEREEPLVGASPLFASLQSLYEDSKNCAGKTNQLLLPALSAESGNYTSAVYFFGSRHACPGSYEYEVSIEKAVVDIPPYKGVVDDISNDSPTTFTATMPCGTPGIGGTPEDWDFYQLNLQSNYCYTIKVKRVDCDMNPQFSLYKGIATAANSPAYSSQEALVGALPLASPGDWYSYEDSKNCAGKTDQLRQTGRIVDSGNYTLAVYYGSSWPACSDSYEYEVSIEKEDCPVGENIYNGKTDVGEGSATVGVSARCDTEIRGLWQLNLEADRCYSFTMSGHCDSPFDFSLHQGIATSAIGDPDALSGATLVEGEKTYKESFYCEYHRRVQLESNTTKMDTNEAPFTLVIEKGIGLYDGVYARCRPSDITETLVTVESKLCKGLLEGCSNNTECASDICTGRPGKPKKCRYCARKKETCSQDSDCCQSRKFPNRYCNNGQCKKRSSPLMLAYFQGYPSSCEKYGCSYSYGYYVIDMTTWEKTTVKSFFFDGGGNSESVGDNAEELRALLSAMEYDANTGILWTSRSGGKLDKRDAFYNTIETFSLESSAVAMETVEGEIYAILKDEKDVLVTINQADGVATTIGAITGLDESQGISGLAYDGTSLYGATDTSPHQLVTIDMGTGKVTSSVPLEVGGVSSLDFEPDGVLYAFTGGSYTRVDKTTGNVLDGSGLLQGDYSFYTIVS